MARSRKLARIALAIAAGILLLTAFAAIAAYCFIDGTRWIPALEQRASKATGRTVKITSLHLQLLPTPGLDASGVSIANPSWAAAPQLMVAQQVSGRFALWPLLHGQLQPANLSAHGVQVNLETDANGAHSWTFPPAAAPVAGSHLGALDLSRISTLRLNQIAISHRSPYTVGDTPIWQVEHANVEAKSGWQQVDLEALVQHHGHTLNASGHLDNAATPARGHIEFKTGSAQVVLDGVLPLGWPPHTVEAANFTVRAEAARPNDLLEFFNLQSRPIAAASFSAAVHGSDGVLHATQVDAHLAKLHVIGTIDYDPSGSKPTIDAQLQMPRLDWVQTLADAGRPPLPPKLPGELFRTHRLAWRVLTALKGLQGTVDLRIGALKTRSGVELTDATARLHFVDDLLQVAPMHAGMLGGSARGTMQLQGHNKAVHLNLNLQDVSLQQWIAALGKKAPLTGGAINLQGNVQSNGATMKELGANMRGPVSLRLGPTVITTEGGALAEEILTGLMPIFSAHKTDQIQLECAAANLSFVAGRAAAAPLVGARSQASQLLTSGFVDLREQTLDLRGRVRARSGISLGLANLAGDVKITGLLTHPQARLDPAGTPAAVARLGAAFATAGLSIVATALWDSANPGTDACQAVFADRIDRSERTSGNQPIRSAHVGEKAVH